MLVVLAHSDGLMYGDSGRNRSWLWINDLTFPSRRNIWTAHRI